MTVILYFYLIKQTLQRVEKNYRNIVVFDMKYDGLRDFCTEEGKVQIFFFIFWPRKKLEEKICIYD